MKQFIIGIFLCLSSFNFNAQIQSSELGIEAFGGGSQLGGTLGGELKYAVKLPNNLIIGPSFRLHRSWSNYLNVNSQFNMYGGGAFAHLRYQDKVFAGVEFQMLHSPFNFITFQSGQKMGTNFIRWRWILLEVSAKNQFEFSLVLRCHQRR